MGKGLFMFKLSTKKIARAGIVGGLYVVLSLIAFPVASGAIQFRISEALTILPLIFPEVSIGLFVGCALTGVITCVALYDIIFGSLITLVAGVLTALIGKVIKRDILRFFVGGLFPVFLNAFFLPVIWYFCYGQLEYLYILQVAFLIVGQGVSVYALGYVFYIGAKRLKEKFS